MSAALASQHLESLAGLFQKSARQDGYKFLNISDVHWKSTAEKLVSSNVEVKGASKLPKPFAEDPFALFAEWSGSVKEVEIAQNSEQHLFETNTAFIQNSAREFSSAVTLVKIKENAKLELVYFQNESEQFFARFYFLLEKNAQLKLTLIQNHVGKGQIRAHIDCLGEGAEALVHGLTVGKNAERQDLWVDVVHSVPHTRSDLVAWCSVADRAHSVFNGKMTIEQTAPFTEAFQKNKNLILSDGASVDTFPKLFIWNNEVKCAHGSSVSSLEPDQLMYLQSRGIDRTQAERMLQKGFVRQAIEWISNRATLTTVETALLGTSESEEALDEKEWGTV